MKRNLRPGMLYRISGGFILLLLLVSNLAQSTTPDDSILGTIVNAIQGLFSDPASTTSSPPSQDPGTDTTVTDGQDPTEPPPPPPDPD